MYVQSGMYACMHACVHLCEGSEDNFYEPIFFFHYVVANVFTYCATLPALYQLWSQSSTS